MYSKILNKIYLVCKFVIALIMGLLIVTCTAAVFFRYVLQQSLFWADELMRYSFIWMVLFSMPMLIKDKGMIAVDLTSMIFPKKIQPFAFFAGQIVCLSSIVILFIYSLILVQKSMAITSSSLQIPLGYVLICLPIGFFLSFLFYIKLIFVDIKNKYSDEDQLTEDFI